MPSGQNSFPSFCHCVPLSSRDDAELAYIEHDLAEELVFSNIRTPSEPLKALSGRDLEILRLLAKGSTLLQIVDTVGVSYKTAANNCGQIKAKLGTASTADLNSDCHSIGARRP